MENNMQEFNLIDTADPKELKSRLDLALKQMVLYQKLLTELGY